MEALAQLVEAVRACPTGEGPVMVALDGPCASGKSTLGTALAERLACPLFHMDDFFLSPAQKTPQRLAQPGGNVDWERFLAEVLLPLSRGEGGRYRPYRCHTGTLGEPVPFPATHLAVVEGVYSLHPSLRPYYALTCFVEAPLPVREERLLQRCGPEGLERFRTLWIPLENQYFQALNVRAHCQMVVSTI